MRATIRPTVLAVAVLTLAACAGETSSPLTDDTPVGQTATETRPDDDGATGPAAVDIDDFRFAPETITVPVGSEITWTNQDATAHTVTAGSEQEPRTDDVDLDVTAQGDTVSSTFAAPGTYDYFCELHPFMQGTVEVTG